MKLSVIIPVYNAEKYLTRCLESVCCSLSRAEIEGEILAVIDSGSTDGSREILKQWQKRLKTEPVLQRNTGKGTLARSKKALALMVVECQAPGAGAARNYGLSRAKGEYAWFIDADDEIALEAVEKLLRAAERGKPGDKPAQANLVMMGAERVFPDGRRDYLPAVTTDDPERISRFIRYEMGPWQVMFRRAWWVKNGFSFCEGMIHEDMELMSVLILYAGERYATVDEPLYFYYQTPNSVLHKRNWDGHAYDIFPALAGLYGRFKALGVEKRYHDELEWFFIWNLLVDSAKVFATFPEGREGFSRSREMLKKYFPGWRHNRFLRK